MLGVCKDWLDKLQELTINEEALTEKERATNAYGVLCDVLDDGAADLTEFARISDGVMTVGGWSQDHTATDIVDTCGIIVSQLLTVLGYVLTEHDLFSERRVRLFEGADNASNDVDGLLFKFLRDLLDVIVQLEGVAAAHRS